MYNVHTAIRTPQASFESTKVWWPMIMLNRKLVDPGESRVLLHLPRPIPGHALSLFRWRSYLCIESHTFNLFSQDFVAEKKLQGVIKLDFG